MTLIRLTLLGAPIIVGGVLYPDSERGMNPTGSKVPPTQSQKARVQRGASKSTSITTRRPVVRLRSVRGTFFTTPSRE